jgi:hypothetical protein
MMSTSTNDRRAPLWWRLMQLLTALAVVAYLLSATACAPHETTASAPAKRTAAAALDASSLTWDANLMRFDHSVVNRPGQLEPALEAGASVAAYEP